VHEVDDEAECTTGVTMEPEAQDVTVVMVEAAGAAVEVAEDVGDTDETGTDEVAVCEAAVEGIVAGADE